MGEAAHGPPVVARNGVPSTASDGWRGGGDSSSGLIARGPMDGPSEEFAQAPRRGRYVAPHHLS